jgi:hypothetical protein
MKKKFSPNLYLFWTQRCLWQRWWKYLYEYLPAVETEFEKSLECESGAHMGSIYEENQRPKISYYCPFKVTATLIKLQWLPGGNIFIKIKNCIAYRVSPMFL